MANSGVILLRHCGLYITLKDRFGCMLPTLQLACLVISKAPRSLEGTVELPIKVMETVVAVFIRVLT